jgi:hypothetical protein
MSLENIGKLEFLGFKFWEKKSSEGLHEEEINDCFVVIQSILFCFSNRTLLNNSFEHIQRFVTSISRTLNSKETCKFLESAPKGIPLKKIILFGDCHCKESLEKEYPDINLVHQASFEDLFSNSQLKKELWACIKD